MVDVDVQCDAILKFPVIYANLVVDEFFSQYIREYPHDYEWVCRPRTCGFLDKGKEIIVIYSLTYNN